MQHYVDSFINAARTTINNEIVGGEGNPTTESQIQTLGEPILLRLSRGFRAL
jgi:hypothetical protein